VAKLQRDTSILARKSRRMDRIIREAIEMELHLNNRKREGNILSKAWKSSLSITLWRNTRKPSRRTKCSIIP